MKSIIILLALFSSAAYSQEQEPEEQEPVRGYLECEAEAQLMGAKENDKPVVLFKDKKEVNPGGFITLKLESKEYFAEAHQRDGQMHNVPDEIVIDLKDSKYKTLAQASAGVMPGNRVELYLKVTGKYEYISMYCERVLPPQLQPQILKSI